MFLLPILKLHVCACFLFTLFSHLPIIATTTTIATTSTIIYTESRQTSKWMEQEKNIEKKTRGENETFNLMYCRVLLCQSVKYARNDKEKRKWPLQWHWSNNDLTGGRNDWTWACATIKSRWKKVPNDVYIVIFFFRVL